MVSLNSYFCSKALDPASDIGYGWCPAQLFDLSLFVWNCMIVGILGLNILTFSFEPNLWCSSLFWY